MKIKVKSAFYVEIKTTYCIEEMYNTTYSTRKKGRKMINVESLIKGDKFYHCCEYHWKVRYEYIQVLKDGRIKVKYTNDVGIFHKGEIEYLSNDNLKECFLDKKSAEEYQKKCRSRIKNKTKDELLKEIFNKADNAGIFTDEESKLYRQLVYTH